MSGNSQWQGPAGAYSVKPGMTTVRDPAIARIRRFSRLASSTSLVIVQVKMVPKAGNVIIHNMLILLN